LKSELRIENTAFFGAASKGRFYQSFIQFIVALENLTGKQLDAVIHLGFSLDRIIMLPYFSSKFLLWPL
jgi:hypothetical protein